MIWKSYFLVLVALCLPSALFGDFPLDDGPTGPSGPSGPQGPSHPFSAGSGGSGPQLNLRFQASGNFREIRGEGSESKFDDELRVFGFLDYDSNELINRVVQQLGASLWHRAQPLLINMTTIDPDTRGMKCFGPGDPEPRIICYGGINHGVEYSTVWGMNTTNYVPFAPSIMSTPNPRLLRYIWTEQIIVLLPQLDRHVTDLEAFRVADVSVSTCTIPSASPQSYSDALATEQGLVLVPYSTPTGLANETFLVKPGNFGDGCPVNVTSLLLPKIGLDGGVMVSLTDGQMNVGFFQAVEADGSPSSLFGVFDLYQYGSGSPSGSVTNTTRLHPRAKHFTVSFTDPAARSFLTLSADNPTHGFTGGILLECYMGSLWSANDFLYSCVGSDLLNMDPSLGDINPVGIVAFRDTIYIGLDNADQSIVRLDRLSMQGMHVFKAANFGMEGMAQLFVYYRAPSLMAVGHSGAASDSLLMQLMLEDEPSDSPYPGASGP